METVSVKGLNKSYMSIEYETDLLHFSMII